MLKRTLSGIMLTLLLIGMLTAFNVPLGFALTRKITVPDDYPTIQEAINNANEGDTIYVLSGTYYENVVVDKSVSLIGENKSTTIIDGNRTGNVVDVTANNTAINGFTIQNSGTFPKSGIYVDLSSGNNISHNVITKNIYGIQLQKSSSNTISENDALNNDYGICLTYSSNNNTVYGNTVFSNNWYGIMLDYSNGNVVSGNAVSNNNIGIRLFGSRGHVVYGNNISNNNYGIILEGIYGSSNNTIAHNTVSSCYNGIILDRSSNNTLNDNTISNNQVGTSLSSRLGNCTNNEFFHNNFICNTLHVYDWSWDNLDIPPSINSWDNGYPSGGNYWSDYTGVDDYSGPYQNVTGSDGIGDSPYVIDEDNADRYPLMHPWSSLPVHNINTGLGYATIQEAIDAPETLDGHTILVDVGTYAENVVVNKSISLIGENKSTTIMDGMGTGTVIHVTAINVNISGFTIQNSGGWLPDGGIHLDGSSGSSIYSNTISNNGNGVVLSSSSGNVLNQNVITQSPGFGIYLVFSQNNAINGNNVSNCGSGIELVYGSGNILRDNNMTDNGYNFGVQGISLSEFIHDIDTSNTVDGKPIYYWVNKNDKQIPSDAGFVAAVNSTKISVNGLTLTKNEFGVLFAYTTDSLIENTAVLRNWIGVHLTHSNGIIIRNNTVFRTGGINLVHSGNNIIVGNIITDNYDGITLRYDCNANEISSNTISGNYRGTLFLGFSSDNSIYHNNFIDNENQMSNPDSSISFWDDAHPSGGNFWSDYVGVDVKSGPNQDLPESDGIGDTPYIIDADNTDHYPLMGPINFFNAGTWNEVTYYVDTVSNSTVSDFYFSPNEGAFLRFNVTGMVGTTGFCRVTIPKEILWVEDGWIVLVDGEPVGYTLIGDINYTYLFFTYSHSTHEVRIIGTHVIVPPPDTTPPLISPPSQEPEPDNVMPNQMVTVSVDVTDAESGVKAVILSYTTDDGITWTNVTMFLIEGATYSVNIPGLPAGTYVCYKIVAHDNADNFAVRDNNGQYYIYTVSRPVSPLSASISPLSASTNVGESLTFTSTVTGGTEPYSYQWYLNDNPVSGANASSWTFTPTKSGIYYVYLKVTDAKGNTTQSETARITVAAIPVGGCSVPIKGYTAEKPLTLYLALIGILTASFTIAKRRKKQQN